MTPSRKPWVESRWALIVLVVAASAGCGTGSGGHETLSCESSEDCPPDAACISGLCRFACSQDADCAPGEICRDGWCGEPTDNDGGQPDATGDRGTDAPADDDAGADAGVDAGADEGGADAGGGDEPECLSSADCPDDLLCVDGSCVACYRDTDCREEQVCRDSWCTCALDNLCELGGACCPGEHECVDHVCRRPCEGVRCGRRNQICCAPGEVCENQRCMPGCEGRERCGRDLELCCPAGTICYGVSCVDPSVYCQRQIDCPDDMVCELDLGICLERNVVGTCEYRPPAGAFHPAIECRWTPDPDGLDPARNDVVMAPVVANLTDDNGDGRTDIFDVPDIAFISYDLEADGCCNRDGTLRIVTGSCNPDGTMTTLASINEPPLDNSGGLAIGDLDADGVPEIVGVLNNDRAPQGTVAFRRVVDDGSQWEVLWVNTAYPVWNQHTRGGTQPSLADLDGDGTPEVVVGNVVLSGEDGTLLWDGLETVGAEAGIGNNAFLGPVSAVADIDLDGDPEVLAGNTCYGPGGAEEWTFGYTSSNSSCGGALPCDGYTATGNFDDDPEGEVVIVRLGEVFVLHHDGTLLAKVAIPIDDCSRNESGPPTVADFDGDGRSEIGTAAADYYVVVDLDCLSDPLPASCAAPGVLWYVPNQDCSSRVTASSVFDFEGDGKAEVIYADETTFRIFDGTTGAELFVDETHGSHTRLEMVVIADVDNDGNAEVVIAENASMQGTPGVEVWGDLDDNWVFTRRIWNQHNYHVTNVSESGVVPADEDENWLDPFLNNARQNVQGEGLFWAPDLAVVNLDADCELGLSVFISFDVMNQGSRMVPAGVAISLYAEGVLIDTEHTTRALLPGQREHFVYGWEFPPELQSTPFSLRVAADDIGNGEGEHNECDDGGEDNNSAVLDDVWCSVW